MKKIFLTLLTTTLIIFCFGQNKKKLKPAIEDGCQCFSNINLSDTTLTYNSLSKIGEDCAVLAISKHIFLLKNEFKVKEVGDGNEWEDVGEQLGLYLVEDCPGFMTYSIKLNELEESFVVDAAELSKNIDPAKSYEGYISEIKADNMLSIKFITLEGVSHTLYVLHNFKNSDQITENESYVLNKKVKIYFTEKEIYLTKAKGFYTIKEITKLEFF